MPLDSEIKIKLEGLQIGMYVSRADRPWSELPIQLEGVEIHNNNEIDLLNQYCEYVYIDSSKGRSASPMYWMIDDKKQATKSITDLGKNEYTVLRKENYETFESLSNELNTAKDVFNQVSEQIHQSFDSLKENRDINIAGLKEAVAQTVNSVVRNPTALKLVMELQRTDNYSYNHALSTSVWCAQFGRQLGLEKKSIADLSLGGLLLDIGKVKIPEELLAKKGALNSDEIGMLRAHVDFAVQILIGQDELSNNIMRMITSHHERADGSGYPLGILNKEIPIYGRIAGIADSFDAMTSKRPFTSSLFSPHEAINKLYESRGTLFQGDLVEQFIQTVGMYPTGTLVEINTGEIGVVTAINGLKRLKPTVMLILDANKQPFEEFNSLNLSKGDDYFIKQTLKHGAYDIKMDELFL